MENIVLDSKGNAKLCDFGLCKNVPLNKLEAMIRSQITKAPEELVRNNLYHYSIDYWHYEIMVYRMLTTVFPFETDQSILNDEMPDLNEKKKKKNEISQITCDFVSRLLIKDPNERLTSERIKDEVFFKDIDWNKLEAGDLEPPIKPEVFKLFYFKERY